MRGSRYAAAKSGSTRRAYAQRAIFKGNSHTALERVRHPEFCCTRPFGATSLMTSPEKLISKDFHVFPLEPFAPTIEVEPLGTQIPTSRIRFP